MFLSTSHHIFSRSLADNKIRKIETEAFNDVTAHNLNLSGNSLRELYGKSFSSVTLSGDLHIDSMFFSTIPSQAFFGVTASNINISNGVITAIEEEAFYDVVVRNNL